MKECENLKVVPKWTGDAVKKKHLYNINDSEIASVVGKSREIISKTLNGNSSFKDDKKIIMEALEKIISERS